VGEGRLIFPKLRPVGGRAADFLVEINTNSQSGVNTFVKKPIVAYNNR
jgi:hypothetical protein